MDDRNLSPDELKRLLKRLGACPMARDFLQGVDARTAWEKIPADYILFVVEQIDIPRNVGLPLFIEVIEQALPVYKFSPAEGVQERLEAARASLEDPEETRKHIVRLLESFSQDRWNGLRFSDLQEAADYLMEYVARGYAESLSSGISCVSAVLSAEELTAILRKHLTYDVMWDAYQTWKQKQEVD